MKDLPEESKVIYDFIKRLNQILIHIGNCSSALF